MQDMSSRLKCILCCLEASVGLSRNLDIVIGRELGASENWGPQYIWGYLEGFLELLQESFMSSRPLSGIRG